MRPSDAPLYHTGLTVCASAMLLNLVNTGMWWLYYVRENKKRNREFVDSGLSAEERDHQNFLAGETDLTDKQVGIVLSWESRREMECLWLTAEPLLPLLHMIVKSCTMLRGDLWRKSYARMTDVCNVKWNLPLRESRRVGH